MEHMNGGYGGGYGKPRGNSLGGKTHGLPKLEKGGRGRGQQSRQMEEDMPGVKENKENGFIPSRKEVTLVNVNLTGKSVMGYTPR